jgi:hypothetical protein
MVLVAAIVLLALFVSFVMSAETPANHDDSYADDPRLWATLGRR